MSSAMLIALIIVATTAGVLTARREEEAPPQGRGALVRSIAYWLFTVIVAFELAAGALWDLLRIEYVRVVLAQLGYPLYLLIILGVWRIPGALVLLVPRFPRLKEWAYAGMFFNFYGAVASHLFRGDGPSKWVVPLVLGALTIASWALRPADRRLPDANPSSPTRPADWAIPVAILLILFVLSFLTIPKGRGGY